jgi:acyl-CoA synthetase (NDP forming)
MRSPVEGRVSGIVQRVRAEGRDVLLEPEGYAVLNTLGIPTPGHVLIGDSREAEFVKLSAFRTDRMVVKVASTTILHRSDVGGVTVVAREREALVEAVRDMEDRFASHSVAGFFLCEFVEHRKALGGELLLGARWTRDFGPVVTFGPGGIYTEFLCEHLQVGRDVAILSPVMSRAEIEAALEAPAISAVLHGRVRGQEALIDREQLLSLVSRFLTFARQHIPQDFAEFEVNPLVLTPTGPVALDVLAKLGSEPEAVAPERPLHKLAHLLKPATIGIAGVSERMNPGRIILRNILREGFDSGQITVIKPGRDSMDDCACVRDIASLTDKLDLLILCLDASQVTAAVEQVIEQQAAESLILIPGGLGEKLEGGAIEKALRGAIEASRHTGWGGPVVNGGNCLGIRSLPGRYDTLFIPDHKMPERRPEVTPLALISQSGAFACSRASKLPGLNPRYLISLGNQTDLTVSDYLNYLSDDRHVDVFACYVEGFRRGDGEEFLRAAKEIRQSGRVVILYQAGRTAAGARASASHTASIAGDYDVARELSRNAGVVVADSLADFEDLIRLFCQLRHKSLAGWRLGGISNAGFECVAMADNLGPFRLPSFGPHTTELLGELLERCRISAVVNVQNPLDLTPILGDEAFETAAEAVLEDENVDVGIVGCVPMTGALNSLPPGEHHGENIAREGSVASRLIRLRQRCDKPWVAVVDSGPMYDPMAAMLEEAGVPTFRTADRALRLLATWCRNRVELSGRGGIRHGMMA